MNNIFVVLSRHHLDLVQSYILPRKEDDINVLITSSSFSIEDKKWNEVIDIEIDLNNQSNNFINRFVKVYSKARAYKKVVKSIHYLRGEEQLMLYFSSLEDILSNHLFFYFSDGLKATIIEDGILNYYYHSFRSISKLNFYCKFLISKIVGVPMKKYVGHTTGIEYSKSVCQVVREPELAICKEKSIKIEIIKRNVEIKEDLILIIGQEPYANLTSQKQYEEKFKRLVHHIKNDIEYSKCNYIYYKPHRHGPRMDKSHLLQLFKGKAFEYINDDLSIEQMFFNKLQAKFIYTFDSSAVINIYLESEEIIRDKIVISVMPFYNMEINALFSKFNFRILN